LSSSNGSALLACVTRYRLSAPRAVSLAPLRWMASGEVAEGGQRSVPTGWHFAVIGHHVPPCQPASRSPLRCQSPLRRTWVSVCSVLEHGDTRGLTYQSGQCSLGNGNVLLNRPRTCSHGTDNTSARNNRDAATEDDDFAGIAFLNTEKWLSRLRKRRHIRGSFVENSRGYGLVDGKVDAPDERAILAQEGHQVATSIDDRDIISDPKA